MFARKAGSVVVIFALVASLGVIMAAHVSTPLRTARLSSSRYGYVLAGAGGATYSFGSANYGSSYTDGLTGLTGAHPLSAPVVAIATDPSGGYWMAAKDGGVFNFGNAAFHGSTYTYGITGLGGSHPLNAPIVGMAATPGGNGYWLVGADGGVFNFGTASYLGSEGGVSLPAPIVGIGEMADQFVITTTSLPAATSNQNYSTTLNASGGTGTITWSATGLPAGLSISPSGVISGIPAYAGTAAVVITATDQTGHSTTADLSLTVNPKFLTSASPNWSGYIVQNGAFNGVSASFNVASLTSPQPSACDSGSGGSLSQYCAMAEWIGVDGANNSDLIQAGVVEQPVVGTNSYCIRPWWEILPSPVTYFTSSCTAVSAGDSVSVDIHETATPSLWQIQIKDNTSGASFSTQQFYDGPGASAEWIVEAPTSNVGITTLSPYTPVTFTDPRYSLVPSGGVNLETDVVMVQNGSEVSIPSQNANNSFTVSYQ